ncbi:hypothetical protein HKQ51_13135 [Bacteroides vulgatus]|uniref:hypothetical protein n=1 Tax=Phocaeicola vulgatus TaxID=821 RepID=UPI00155EE33A|nr:hypothetical protein [Phocaeicola vulgatus]NMX08797.1 hypothetical protein [Phocaeicola vulgatus]
MEYNCFSFHIFPTEITTSSLVNRMLLIQEYKRQKTDRTSSTFGNETAGHIRFIYDMGFQCCQQIVDSLIESGLPPLKTSLLEQAV